MPELNLIPCCDKPDLRGNDGSVLGFMVIRCYNCGTQMSGRSLEDFSFKWDRLLLERGTIKTNTQQPQVAIQEGWNHDLKASGFLWK